MTQSTKQYLTVISALVILVGMLITFIVIDAVIIRPASGIDVYVGLDIGYGDEQTALEQIDKVASYVNLIILGSLNVTTDTETLTRVCDHIYQKGLNFIVYVAFGQGFEGALPAGPDPQFFVMATEKYGDRFLGVYLFDEVGGKRIDGEHSINVTAANTYSEAAFIYRDHLGWFLGNATEYYAPAQFPRYTSDYALYWYDYLANYSVVFTEYVGSQSRQIATGLCRGAAKSLNKEWGVIVTWSGNPAEFIANPEQLYDDMVLAYQNGAKYIIVFNSPGQFDLSLPYGTLTSAHFEKMKQFWNYVQSQPSVERYPADTAFVLPRDYGYGFRGPNDTIWGKWTADDIAPQIWEDVNGLIEAHVLPLDIVFETEIADKPISPPLPYERLFFWNGTTIQE